MSSEHPAIAETKARLYRQYLAAVEKEKSEREDSAQEQSGNRAAAAEKAAGSSGTDDAATTSVAPVVETQPAAPDVSGPSLSDEGIKAARLWECLKSVSLDPAFSLKAIDASKLEYVEDGSLKVESVTRQLSPALLKARGKSGSGSKSSASGFLDAKAKSLIQNSGESDASKALRGDVQAYERAGRAAVQAELKRRKGRK